jgi:hypothetical protein
VPRKNSPSDHASACIRSARRGLPTIRMFLWRNGINGRRIDCPNGLAPLPFNFIDLVETRHPDLIGIKGH